MSFTIADELMGQLADSAPPVEGATTPPTPPVAEGQPQTDAAATPTPDAAGPDDNTPLDPSILRHGARIGELMVIDPKKGVDITQLESGRKLQSRLTETERRLQELEQAKAKEAKETQRATAEREAKETLSRELGAAKTEKERVAALLKFKNWERQAEVSALQSELEAIRNQQTQDAELKEIDDTIRDWDAYYSEEGYDPDFLEAVNQRAYVASQGNPIAYQNIRHAVILDVTARAARGLIKSPFVQGQEGGTTTPPPPQGQPQAQTQQVLGAFPPSGNNAGQPDLMDMFYNEDLGGLKAALNIRR